MRPGFPLTYIIGTSATSLISYVYEDRAATAVHGIRVQSAFETRRSCLLGAHRAAIDWNGRRIRRAHISGDSAGEVFAGIAERYRDQIYRKQ